METNQLSRVFLLISTCCSPGAGQARHQWVCFWSRGCAAGLKAGDKRDCVCFRAHFRALSAGDSGLAGAGVAEQWVG